MWLVALNKFSKIKFNFWEWMTHIYNIIFIIMKVGWIMNNRVLVFTLFENVCSLEEQ